MPRPPQFLFEFKSTIAHFLGRVSGVSHHDFVRLYDYDDFLDGEAAQCKSARELAIAFAAHFLGAVNDAYFRVLSLALVSYLARQSGRSAGESDKVAVQALADVVTQDLRQLDSWMDAYFPDVL